ncbi:MAG: putative outer membrane repeat protein, partial [Candidatus Krumholzibacteriia bacterium]
MPDGANVTMINATFAQNTASQGGAIHVGNLLSATSFTNSILWDNTGVASQEIFYAQTPTINFDHSLIAGSGGSTSWVSAIGVDGGNNLDDDPLFVDMLTGNLRLGLGSPAIDAGDSTAVGLPAYDLDGMSRVYANNVDMGAYESLESGNNGVSAVGEVPGVFGMSSAYPNPFNPSVNLMFEIDRDRDVQMTIFDVRGRVVRNLAEGRWAAGNHVLK